MPEKREWVVCLWMLYMSSHLWRCQGHSSWLTRTPALYSHLSHRYSLGGCSTQTHKHTHWSTGCIYSADYSITSFKQRHARPDNPQLHCLSVIWVTGSKDKRHRSSYPTPPATPHSDSLECVWSAPEKLKTSKKILPRLLNFKDNSRRKAKAGREYLISLPYCHALF